MTYPKIKYHKTGGGSIIVESAAQEKALGDNWVEVKLPTPVTKRSPGRPKKVQ